MSQKSQESFYMSDNVHSSEEICRALQEFSSFQDLFFFWDLLGIKNSFPASLSIKKHIIIKKEEKLVFS